jgi:hypothetical protein
MSGIHVITTKLAAPLSEFSPEFVQAMANRMAVSYHKYGLVAESDSNNIASANLRVQEYQRTGNTEMLVDAANFLMMEYMKRGPEAFRATDSDESPGRVRLDGTVTQARNGA